MESHIAIEAFAGKRFTVMGLGVLGGGVGVVRYLATKGALVTVTDMRPEQDLKAQLNDLGGLPITFHLGSHQIDDFGSSRADVVVRNPAVPYDSPYLLAARDDGVRIDMEMSIFFRMCPSPILAVTGTKGKTTVSGLLGKMMKAWRSDAFVAGNMGVSALLELDRLRPDTPVVIELSSFQIEALIEHALGPHIAVITNISQDHLDRYKDFEEYSSTKRGLTHAMDMDDVVVYNRDDVNVARVVGETTARTLSFGLTEPKGDGAWLGDEQELVLRTRGAERSWKRPAALALQGDHGALNALAAIAAARAYGTPDDAIECGLRRFLGVENRLEQVAVVDQVRYVNDTSATAPAAAIASVRVLAPRARTLHLIAGGADKRTDLAPFADEIRAANARVYLLDGTVTDQLQELLAQRSVTVAGRFQGMADALELAAGSAAAGDIVALCPGCASFGMFRNEFDRGNQFRAAVRDLQRRVTLATASSADSGARGNPGHDQEGMNDVRIR